MATETECILCDDGDAGFDRLGERDVVEPDQCDFVLAAGVVERSQRFDRDQVLAGEQCGRRVLRAQQRGGQVVGVGRPMLGVPDEVRVLADIRLDQRRAIAGQAFGGRVDAGPVAEERDASVAVGDEVGDGSLCSAAVVAEDAIGIDRRWRAVDEG